MIHNYDKLQNIISLLIGVSYNLLVSRTKCIVMILFNTVVLWYNGAKWLLVYHGSGSKNSSMLLFVRTEFWFSVLWKI